MILAEVKRLLRERGEATIAVMAAELAADRAMVEAALQYWCGRGAVGQVAPRAAAGRCSLGCAICPHGVAAIPAPRAAVYRWLQ